MKRTTLQWIAISSIAVAMIAPAMARTRPRYGGTVRVQMRGEAFGPDVRAIVAESLTAIDEAGRVQPKLAARWESQNGDRRWQFWLRTAIRFHDGTALTPASVVKALSTGECETCPWSSVRVAADSVVFESDTPMPQLPARLASADFNITKNEDRGGTLVGTGPFRVTSAMGGLVQLSAFDDYWGGRAFLDAVDVAGAKRRDAGDMTAPSFDITELSADQLRRAQQSRMRTLTSRPLTLVVLSIGASSRHLEDLNAREAIVNSIDRAALLNGIYQRQGEITGSILPQWMTGYAFLFPVTQNMVRARELRRTVNVNGAITLAYNDGDPALQLVAERIALNARDAGFTVQTMVRNADTRADMYVSTVRLPSFDASVALDEIRSLFTGPDTQTPAVGAEQLLQRERQTLSSFNIIPLLYTPRAYAAGDRVRSLRLTDLGTPDIANMWVEQRR